PGGGERAARVRGRGRRGAYRRRRDRPRAGAAAAAEARRSAWAPSARGGRGLDRRPHVRLVARRLDARRRAEVPPLARQLVRAGPGERPVLDETAVEVQQQCRGEDRDDDPTRVAEE